VDTIRVDTAGLTAVAADLGNVAPRLHAAAAAVRAAPRLWQPEVAGPLTSLVEVVSAACDAGGDDVTLVSRRIRDAASTYDALDLIFGGLPR
jgi:hypothetical protein